MNLDYEIRKLKEQVNLHGQVLSYLAELNVRLIAASSDPTPLLALLEEEAKTDTGERLKPLFDRMLAAVRPEPVQAD